MIGDEVEDGKAVLQIGLCPFGQFRCVSASQFEDLFEQALRLDPIRCVEDGTDTPADELTLIDPGDKAS